MLRNSSAPTVTAYSADNISWPTADGGAIRAAADVVDASVNVNVNVIAADVIEAAAALDALDAKVKRAAGFGVGFRPAAIVGVGYGILPTLVGEAHGVVCVAGAGAAMLRRGAWRGR